MVKEYRKNSDECSRRILFVSLSRFDEVYSSTIRNMGLINGFLKLGFKVDVVGVGLDFCRKSSQTLWSSDCVRFCALDEFTAKTVVERLKGRPTFLTKVLRFFFQRLSVLEYFPKKWLLLEGFVWADETYAYLVSSSDPKTSHLLAQRIRGRLGCQARWIQYWGDPLADDITRRLILPRSFLLKSERRIIQNCDKIVYTSPITLRIQKSLFPEYAKKMMVIPTPSMKGTLKPLTKTMLKIVGYHGSYDPRIRNIVPLIRAVGKLGDDWRLEIVGPQSKLSLGLPMNVSIEVTSKNIEQYEDRAHVLVVLMNKGGSQIPGKLYHLAPVNRPILVIIDGDFPEEIKEYVDSFGRFFTCSNDSVEIAEALSYIDLRWEDATLGSSRMDLYKITAEFLE